MPYQHFKHWDLLLGVYIFNLRKTWEKLVMAARIIVAIENPADVCVISARPYSQVCIAILVSCENLVKLP